MTLTKTMAAILVTASLAGCGDSKEEKSNGQAQLIVDDVKALWHSVMPFEPGERQTGNLSMTKEFVVSCATKMSEASNKLKSLKTDYPSTEVLKSDSTIELNNDVVRWANTCNELKNKQGW